jgi:cytochrome b561
METPKRYHPLMVTMHWLTVILLLGAGILSGQGPSSSPISIHMVFGGLLLVVMLVRLVTRFTVKRPAPADAGNPILNKVGELVHIGLYAAAFYILILGGLIASQRNLIGYVFGNGSVERVSRELRSFHELGWFVTALLVLLHIGGALYHQVIRKDNLISRMWFGNK